MRYILTTVIFTLLSIPSPVQAASIQVDAFLIAKPMSQRDTIYNTDCYRYEAEMGCNDKDVDIFISTDDRKLPPIENVESTSVVQYIYQ